MSATEFKRSTVYLEPALHKAVKTKASLASLTMSDLINEAIRESLQQDAFDIEAVEQSENETSYALEDVLEEFNFTHLLK